MTTGDHEPTGPAEQDMLGRLQDADPARGESTDLAALRAAVHRRLDGDTAAPEEPRPARRGPGSVGRWMIAAVLAAALAVGGYGIGAQRESGSVTDQADTAHAPEDAPPALLDAPEPERDGDGSGADAGAPATGVQFIDGGLPVQTGQGRAWVMDTASAYDAEVVGDLAQRLGVDGDVRYDGDEMAVIGSERSVRVQADAVSTMTYHDAAVENAGAPADPLAAAEDFLAAVGTDTASLTLTEQPAAEDDSVQVVATALDVEAITWQITLTQAGVSAAQGPLAQPVSLGQYPTISAAQAVQRLADPAFAASAATSSDQAGPLSDDAADEERPSAPDPGSALPWPVRQVEFTGATLGVAGYYSQDSRQLLLLPTWTLDAGAAGTWQVLAVEESALDTD